MWIHTTKCKIHIKSIKTKFIWQTNISFASDMLQPSEKFETQLKGVGDIAFNKNVTLSG